MEGLEPEGLSLDQNLSLISELGIPLSLSDPVFEKGIIIIGATLLGLCDG